MLREITSDADFKQVIAGEVPVVVMFGSPQCPHCRLTKPGFKAFARRYPRIPVYYVDSDELFMLATAQKVNRIPMLMVFRGGKLLKRSIGQKDSAEIESFVEGALS